MTSTIGQVLPDAALLAAYKVPRAVQFTTQLPMTSSGKIMRRLLTDIDDGTRTTASDLAAAAS
jgi:acyl-coenzyme A synthetase/AMP-(fatty) acid ligase